MKQSAEDWIDHLQLEPHPEGGWFSRIYQSEQQVVSEFSGERPALSSIYYLLEAGTFSAFHRLKQDEQWHFYAGTALTIHMISPDGHYSFDTLSSDGPFQCTIPAGTFFAATVKNEPDAFALVGCTVAPGYEDADFDMPTRADLVQRFPKHKTLIQQLTRDEENHL